MDEAAYYLSRTAAEHEGAGHFDDGRFSGGGISKPEEVSIKESMEQVGGHGMIDGPERRRAI